MKKFKKILTIVLFTFAGIVGLIVVAAIIAGPTSNDNKAEASQTSQEATTETKASESTKEKDVANKSREAYQKATSDLYVAQTNMGADFQLIADESQNGISTDALQNYKDDIDLTLANLTQIQQDTSEGVDENDLKNADDKLLIDTQLSETVKDLITVATTASDYVQTMIDGTTTQADMDELTSVQTTFQNTQYTLKALDGIGDNNDNWK